MTVDKRVGDSSAKMKISGWLDTQSAPELEKAINDLGPDVKELTLDCSELEYISSAGLRLLVEAYKKMAGNVILRHVSAEIMSVIKMTGLDKRLIFE